MTWKGHGREKKDWIGAVILVGIKLKMLSNFMLWDTKWTPADGIQSEHQLSSQRSSSSAQRVTDILVLFQLE